MAASGASNATPARLIRASENLRIVTFNADLAVADDQLVVKEPAYRTRIDDVLLTKHARGERFRRVALAYRHFGLDHDRAVVELLGDEMHRAAVGLQPRGKSARVRFQAGERGQKRGMNVEQPSGIARHEGGCQHSHEPRERHQPRREAVDLLRQSGVKGVAAGKTAVIHHPGHDAMRRCDGEPFGVSAVADHGGHWKPRLEQRLHVAAASGYQDHDGHGQYTRLARYPSSSSSASTPFSPYSCSAPSATKAWPRRSCRCMRHAITTLRANTTRLVITAWCGAICGWCATNSSRSRQIADRSRSR